MTTLSSILDGSTRVELRSTLTSPFGRKVRIAAEHLGLLQHMTIRPADTRDPDDDLRDQNPLGKMPCLLVDGEAFYDSGVILELLDALAGGGRLLPSMADPVERLRFLTRARLADGITEAALLMVYEGRFRRPEQASKVWLDHQRGKVLRGLRAFSDELPQADRLTLVSVSLACALGYLDWRRPVAWKNDFPKLQSWLETFAAAVPAFASTEGVPA